MKSIKKRFKLLLTEIDQTANELALLCADLPLLSEIHQLAGKVLSANETLRLEISELKKAEFREEIAESEALAALDEIADTDAISLLEERFFAEHDNHADGIGEFLQQLLDKIGNIYTKMVENIQQLTALPDEE